VIRNQEQVMTDSSANLGQCSLRGCWGQLLVVPRLRVGLCLLMLAMFLPVVAKAEAAARPNILFILTDDQAPTAVGFNGNTELKTPHIDRIAHEGARLVNSFVTTPVCSPSRAGLAVSRYGSEVGIIDWINPGSEQLLGLNPNTITWMELLQEAGYVTGLSGKWHLGTDDPFHPTLSGYDEFVGIRDGGCPAKDAVIEIGGHDVKQTTFTCDVFTDHAIDFIKRHKEESFALSLHYRAPHSPWLPVAPEDLAPYKDLDPTLPDPDFPNLQTERVKKMVREYYASVASVDRNVGRVLDLLDELKLAENTVVIFTSDHGYHTGHHGLWFKGNAHWMTKPLPEQQWPKIPPLRRPNLYDQALRVPTAVRWPGVIPAGSDVERTVTNLDWYPTLLAMAGVEIPTDFTIHGHNALPILKGEKVAWNDEFFCEYSMRHGATTDMRGWRTPDWKLMIDDANIGRVELYNLKEDPGEKTNLADSKDASVQEVKQGLEAKIRQRMEEIGLKK